MSRNHSISTAIAVTLVSTVTLLAIRCRKIETSTNQPRFSVQEKFFRLSEGTHPKIKAIAKVLERQNSKYNFVPSITEKYGYPEWDKAIVKSKLNTTGRLNTATDSLGRFFLPFNLDSSIAATLVVSTGLGDTAFKFLTRSNYDELPFDTASGGWTALDVFILFSHFDRIINDNFVFQIYDRRLFPNGDTTQAIVAKINEITTSDAGRIVPYRWMGEDWPVWVCTNYSVCYVPEYAYEEECVYLCTENCPYYYNESPSDCINLWYNLTSGASTGGGSADYTIWWGNDTSNSLQVGWGPYDFAPGYIADYENLGYTHLETELLELYDSRDVNDFRTENIDTTGLHPCFRQVIGQLLIGQNNIGKLMAKMERSIFKDVKVEKFHIDFKESSSLPAGVLGRTAQFGSYNSSTGVYRDTIYLNTGMLDSSSQLGMAIVIMHEVVHAYLKSIFYRYFGGQHTAKGMDSLFSIFVDTLKAINIRKGVLVLGDQPVIQHNFMARHLIERFAKALKDVDNLRNNDEFYWCLAWTGLEESPTYRQFWPNFPFWPPSTPAPHNDSLYGFKYALTQARIDSIYEWTRREHRTSSLKKGRLRIFPECF